MQQANRNYSVEVREMIDDTGSSILFEHFEAIVPITAIDHADKNKIACEACHKFGKNFACPPYSPSFKTYAGSHRYARVICIRMPQEYYKHLVQEEIYRACFSQARAYLVEELIGYRKKGFVVAGCGYCQACEVCGAEQGIEACIKPEKMIYSLEAMGVNLTDLTRTCFQFELEWNAQDYGVDFVCALGAVLYTDLEATH